MCPRRKTHGHSFEELTLAMAEAGWVSHLDDMSWRHPSGEACSVEALQLMCQFFSGLSGQLLRMLQAGRGFNLHVGGLADTEDCFTVTLRATGAGVA